MTLDAADLIGRLVLENGQCWGDIAHREQWRDALTILNIDSSTPYHFLTRARGWSKTTDLAAIIATAMITQLPPGARVYAAASDREQGRLIIDAIRGFVERTPLLAGAFDISNFRVVATRRNVILDVLAADTAGLWGLRPNFVIVDELAQWQNTAEAARRFEALTTALTKVDGALLVAITSAGEPGHWSYQIRQHADADVLWDLHEIAGPPPWADPERLAEQRRRLTEASYRRLYENEWTSGDDRLVTLEDLEACATLEGTIAPQRNVRYVIGVDIGIRHDSTAVAVCHAEPTYNDADGRSRHLVGQHLIVDHLETRTPRPGAPIDLTQIEIRVAALADSYNNAEIVLDPWQATGISQRLQTSRYKTHEYTFSATGNMHLASTLYQNLRNHTIQIPKDGALINELANLHLIETSPGNYRIDHDSNRHDDRAIAIALAAQHLLNKPAPRRGRIIV